MQLVITGRKISGFYMEIAPQSGRLCGAEAGFCADEKAPYSHTGLCRVWMPGSSLLSHGETPHYHRRYGVSLLSSAWVQVGPPRSGRQANSVVAPPAGRTTYPGNKLKIASLIKTPLAL